MERITQNKRKQNKIEQKNPPKAQIVWGGLAIAFSLAALVCILHGINALNLRGSLNVPSIPMVQETKDLYGVVPQVDEVTIEGGILLIRGAVVRPNTPVGEVRLRVGLAFRPFDGEQETCVQILPTQLVRRYDLAEQYGCDDHCGFAASVRAKTLQRSDGQYAVVLLEDTDEEMRVLATDLASITLMEDGALFTVRVEQMDEPSDNSQEGTDDAE